MYFVAKKKEQRIKKLKYLFLNLKLTELANSYAN